MDDNYPPFTFRAGDGTVQGILVDEWRLWEQRTGIKVLLSAMDWSQALQRMRAGEFDVIDSVFRTPDREAWLDFTPPYQQIDVPIFFQKQITGIAGPSSLKGFVVAAKAGDAAVGVLQRAGVDDIKLYPNYESIIQAARDGKITVFVVDQPPAFYYLNKYGISDSFKMSEPLSRGAFHRAVGKGRAALLRQVEQGFAAIAPEELHRIQRHWCGTDIPVIATYVKYGVALLLGVALVLLVWNRMLVAAVARRTADLAAETMKRKEGEDYFRYLFDHNPAVMLIYERHTLAILAVNESFVSQYGYTREEVCKLILTDLYPEMERDAVREQALTLHGLANVGERHHIKKGGDVINVMVQSHDFEYGGKSGRIAVIFDITQRVLLENQLRQAQKMEALGRLAGGVAHDFNNKLAVILGWADLLRVRHLEDREYQDGLENILVAAKRARDLTRQLLAFSRKEAVQPRKLDLNAAITNSSKTLNRIIGEDIHIEKQLDPACWPVMMDPTQFDQIIMNLAVNARDAMPGGGVLSLATANIPACEAAAACPGLQAVDYVRLAIRDTGIGMDAGVLGHVFEPFFTTKEAGHGTGLGLSTIYGIVRQNGGQIRCESSPGAGTAFFVYLPRLLNEVPEEDLSEKQKVPGKGTILLVEDDAQVRAMTGSMLRLLGYKVVEAPGPEAAIRSGQLLGLSLDLILTDLVMPGMSGREMIRRMAPCCPGVPVLFMSAHVADPAQIQGFQLIEKPFDSESLGARLQEVLSRHPGSCVPSP